MLNLIRSIQQCKDEQVGKCYSVVTYLNSFVNVCSRLKTNKDF